MTWLWLWEKLVQPFLAPDLQSLGYCSHWVSTGTWELGPAFPVNGCAGTYFACCLAWTPCPPVEFLSGCPSLPGPLRGKQSPPSLLLVSLLAGLLLMGQGQVLPAW